MVDDDDLALKRFFARELHEALFVVRTAFRPETILPGTRHIGPEPVRFGDVGKFRLVARFRDFRKAFDLAELFIGIPLGQEPLFAHALQAVQAHVVRTPLEDCGAHVEAERAREDRNVFFEKLILKGLAGR